MRYKLQRATWIVARERGEPSPRLLTTPEAIARFAVDLIRVGDDDREHFWVILLNARNRYLLHAEVAVGTLNSSLVHPREVFGPALREGAASLVVVHNHPSGDASPSPEDLVLTRRLLDTGNLVGIPLLDHVIIGNGSESWISMRAQSKLEGAWA